MVSRRSREGGYRGRERETCQQSVRQWWVQLTRLPTPPYSPTRGAAEVPRGQPLNQPFWPLGGHFDEVPRGAAVAQVACRLIYWNIRRCVGSLVAQRFRVRIRHLPPWSLSKSQGRGGYPPLRYKKDLKKDKFPDFLCVFIQLNNLYCLQYLVYICN